MPNIPPRNTYRSYNYNVGGLNISEGKNGVSISFILDSNARDIHCYNIPMDDFTKFITDALEIYATNAVKDDAFWNAYHDMMKAYADGDPDKAGWTDIVNQFKRQYVENVANKSEFWMITMMGVVLYTNNMVNVGQYQEIANRLKGIYKSKYPEW